MPLARVCYNDVESSQDRATKSVLFTLWTPNLAEICRQKYPTLKIFCFFFFWFLVAMMLTKPPIDRSVWSLRRSSEWLHMAETTFTDRQWCKKFCISRETFQYIVSDVEHEIHRQDTRFQKAVCPSTKVAILLSQTYC